MRRFRLVALLAVFALVIAACGDDDAATTTQATTATTAATTTTAGDGGTDTTQGESTTTTAAPTTTAAAGLEGTLKVLLHQNPPLVEYMEGFNERFEAANPGVEIEMEVVSAADQATAIQTRLTANEVDVVDFCPAPCSAFSNAIQPYMTDVDPPLWQQLIEAGLVADLTGEAFVANWDQTAVADAGSYDGSVYALPAGRVSYSGMFVNLDLLADNGLETPTTWDALVDACAVLTASGNSCMTVGGADGWPVFVGSYGLLGAFFPDQEALVEGLWTGEIEYTDEEMLELMRRYQTYATELLEEGVTGIGHDAGPARFAAGDVAFMPTGVWQGPAVEAAEPGFDWTYVPFPGSSDEADNQYLFGKYDMSWMIAENAPNKDAAMAYVAALSDPAEYQTFVDAVGLLPTQPTATLDSKLGQAVAPLLENYRVGMEQVWVAPTGAGQWHNAAMFGSSWFAPFNEFTDPENLAQQAQADLEAGLDS
ncbi:MAG: extracellular solute-binding protein [Acidimicrobiia bacterium]|nr:extracellular solute-binding protein [Acidimicrobiia bacterium]